MSDRYTRYIYWRVDMDRKKKGQRFAHAPLLGKYTQETITDFIKLAEEMRKTFPQATDDKVVCATVRKSDRVKGFTIITFNSYIPEGDYSNWMQRTSNPEYRW